MCVVEEAYMQKTLAWVAVALAGSLAGCAKDKQKEHQATEVQPPGPATATEVGKREAPVEPVARTEPKKTPASATAKKTPAPDTTKMTPASGTTKMTPASGTMAPAAGPQAGPELAVGSRGAVLLQEEAASELAAAI